MAGTGSNSNLNTTNDTHNLRLLAATKNYEYKGRTVLRCHYHGQIHLRFMLEWWLGSSSSKYARNSPKSRCITELEDRQSPYTWRNSRWKRPFEFWKKAAIVVVDPCQLSRKLKTARFTVPNHLKTYFYIRMNNKCINHISTLAWITSTHRKKSEDISII